MEFEPPVSWFQISSGRASASVTWTWSIARSISSAIVIATAVVIPCPTSARGSANEAVPSGLTVTVIRPRRRSGRLGQEVGEVVVVDWLMGGDRRGRRLHAELCTGDERGSGDQVAEKPSAGDPASGRLNTKHL